MVLIIIMIGASLTGCSSHNQPVSKSKNSISGTIQISTLSSNQFLKEAVKKFESRHPNVKVEINAYLTPEMLKQNDSNKIVDNYISTLNTQLMSGKGADIIYVNALPYKKYAKRHMFADLNQLMKADPDYDAGKYYTNLFDAVEINHNLYTLPIEYLYDLLESKNAIDLDDRSWNWQDFFKAAQTGMKDQECYILPVSDEDLFNIIFRKNYGHFVNEEKSTASFDSKEFIALLRQCKDLADKNQIAESSAKSSPAEGKPALFRYHDGVSSISALAASQDHLYRLPSDDKGRYCFGATMYAINDASPNKTAAWEFLKFLISDDMQTSPPSDFR